MKNTGREKRRYRREKMVAEVYFKDEKNQSFGGCVSKDISECGVCVQIKEFFPVGTVLELQFKLPLSSTTFYVQGTVRWINKMPYNEQWDVGLEVHSDTHYTALVKKFIVSKDFTTYIRPV